MKRHLYIRRKIDGSIAASVNMLKPTKTRIFLVAKGMLKVLNPKRHVIDISEFADLYEKGENHAIKNQQNQIGEFQRD